ncbi:hypothetical protein [Marinifilum sp.]|uniref:hypothetical protein n=1 Tax=Marinifilum sp. TaxID=2033137 RepID=UPI003BAB243D
MKKLSFILLAGLAVSFFSCDNHDDVEEIKPEEQIVLNNDIETVVSTEEASEAVMEVADYEVDLFSFMESEYSGPTSSTKQGTRNFYGNFAREWKRYKSEKMPEITIEFGDEGRFPMTIKVEYDSTELYNGKIIDGEIEIVMTAAPWTDEAVREIELDLTIDSVEIEGEKRIEFTKEEGETRKWEITSEITFTYPDGTELSRVAERTREWIAGLDTRWNLEDDKVRITGKVTCVDTEENEYTKEIDEENPLIRIGTCRLIVEGRVIYSQNGEEFAWFDYGDGTCDNIATYTYIDENDEKVTNEVEIGKHKRHRKK